MFQSNSSLNGRWADEEAGEYVAMASHNELTIGFPLLALARTEPHAFAAFVIDAIERMEEIERTEAQIQACVSGGSGKGI